MYKADQLNRPSQHDESPATPPASGERRITSAAGKADALRSDTGEAPQARPSPPPKSTKPPNEKPSAPKEVAQPTRRHLVRWATFAALPFVLIAGGYWYVSGGQMMSTDDAYVEADKVGISTDVSGIVKDIDVTDNQHVNAGQILYRLDPRQFQIALDNTKANLAQVALTLDSMKQDYRRMLSDVAAQQSQVKLDQATFDRFEALVRTDAISKASYDQARFTLELDKNKLQSLQQQAQVQLARLAGNPDIPVTELPQYVQAKAQVDEAQRQLDHTVVNAPFDGVVTGVPSIAPGKYLAASTTAFYLVATDHVWIYSNPKETELTYVRQGQPVTVTVDTYPDVKWHGAVESISPAAAQEFSLLPAQNTSGNWVKVVQRIPMRVRLDTSDKSRPALRAGMSVVIDVNTGHRRGLPQFLSALSGRSHGSS
jgi:membrane fusion protein (multidrug efflux system)